ncbi:MAG: YARHG domain-containing protein [Crocinitomicaceae bacterium]|nr:YARHG domain-containing protein [Crocinitomicaceae bacterium]
MKKLIYLIGISTLILSCGGSENHDESGENSSADTINAEGDLLASTTMDPRTFGGEKHTDQSFIDENIPMADNHPDGIHGSYVGPFGKNMINITIYKTEDGKAEGYSVCAGNFRKISGTFDLMQGDEYTFNLSEPGDDQYDGQFEFTLDASEETVKGKWTPFKKEGNSPKEYTLTKRAFKYDPTIGKYPQASQRELTDEDLNNLLEDELAEMRNEIYARHGYSFKNKDWRYHFEEMDWYMPMGIDIRDKLTEIEVINIELIYQYESYFEDYYDDYGR